MNEDKVKSALAPDNFSQAKYTGMVAQTETVVVFDENGTPIQKEVTFYISWSSIVQILAMVRMRAGL